MGVGKGVGISLAAHVHRQQVGVGRDDGDFAETLVDQVPHQLIAALLVVDDDVVDVHLGEIAVEQQHGVVAVDQAVDLPFRDFGGGDDHAVDLFRPEEADHGVLALDLGVRTGDHQRVACFFGLRFDLVGDVGVKTVRYGGENQTDGLRNSGVETPGQQVRLVGEFPGAGKNPVLGLRADSFFVALSGQHPRNGCFREVQFSGYVFERYSHDGSE